MKGFAERVNVIEEYYFSQKLKEVKKLQMEGKPIINMGIGSPDLPPHPSVVEALCDTARDSNSHGYQNYQGIPELRKSFSDFYLKYYHVHLSHLDEILPLIGSKEGILHVSMTFMDEGDHVLIPDPGYPTYSSVSKMLGLKPIYYRLRKENNWYPDFEELENFDLSKVKLMWVNYPHMPTGAKADLDLFERLVNFAKKHDILLVNDNPYSFILEDTPKSIFQVEGAKEIAIELNSLSKTANMAGWRVGCVTGNSENIKAITKVKSNVDSGMFLGIQNAAIAALNLDRDWYNSLNQVYGLRRELLWKFAEKLNLEFSIDTVGMFIWAKLPNGINCRDYVDKLLYEKNIFVTPGDIFGKQGEGWVRLSLCVKNEEIEAAIKRLEFL
ncbi:pyridoxal phosphate-dependent aminotransferase [Shivajiella indica]|uniref:Aminotransferase n=1 Tax=Shivajiella indica TaxID=872115 RepID=A0ABW5BBN8_9BACT